MHIALAEQQTWPRDGVALALEVKQTKQLIGAIRLELQDGINRLADIGFVLNRAFWGQGFATEAARSVVDAAFHKLHLHRVCATCDVHNLASARVLEKIGMRNEGLFRKDLLQKGEWRDSRFYAVLAEDWSETKKAE